MAPRFRIVTPPEARAAIAAALLFRAGDARLGEIVLAPHQQAAARHVRRLLSLHGGALLADDVGLGKTFVALAVARAYRSIVVIAPAGICPVWADAAARSCVTPAILSYESLSRRDYVIDADFVILDEAHHARSATAKRYPRIARLTSGADTLLLSATPVPNALRELRSLFALFLGERASALDATELAALVVRRTATMLPAATLPPVHEPEWLDVAEDGSCLAALERLPPPTPPSDGGQAGALLLLGLIRQWASSRAALVAALRRRLAHAQALEDSLTAGRLPTRAELSAWQHADDSMQLAFPELTAAAAAPQVDTDALLQAIGIHRSALRSLLASLHRTPDPDAARATRLLALRAAHPGERILCFSSYAETVHAYWKYLRTQPGTGRLTASGGSIASGNLNRTGILRRFAPRGQRVEAPASIEAITLLLATDLLSEGIDLQDATVVVHLDLPWSPARMEQRVGRVRRLGSTAAAISVYAIRPPAPAESLLRIERRLRRKVAIAAEIIGVPGAVLPREGSALLHHAPQSPAEQMSLLLDRLSAWADAAVDAPPDCPLTAPVPAAAAVRARERGWLALVLVDGEHRLVARVGPTISRDPEHLSRAAGVAESAAPAAGRRVEKAVARALEECSSFAAEWAADECLQPVSAGVSIRRRVLDRVRRAYAGAPPARRAHVAALAAAARTVVTGRTPAGLEHRLATLLTTRLDDDSWLRSVADLGRPDSRSHAGQSGVAVVIAFIHGQIEHP